LKTQDSNIKAQAAHQTVSIDVPRILQVDHEFSKRDTARGYGGMEVPQWVQGKDPVEDLWDKVPQNWKQNMKLVNSFFTFSCIKFRI